MLKWRVLTQTDGKAFLLCDIAIDAQEYYHSTSDRTINGETVYANNYAENNIRAWLNDNFYNTAFTVAQQAIIQTTLVDNSARSTNTANDEEYWNGGENPYASDVVTNDKIFLLSEQEITNSTYGFATSPGTSDSARQFKSTDYAKCQGCWASTSSSYLGNCYFWLRSPSCADSCSAWSVRGGGSSRRSSRVSDSSSGVVPALWLDLGE